MKPTVAESQKLGQIAAENWQNYNETAKGIPLKTQYPTIMEVSSMGSGEGVGVFFNFKPQGNALDLAEVHFFFPTGAKTASEVESYLRGTNG